MAGRGSGPDGVLRDRITRDTGPALRALGPGTNAAVRASATAAVEVENGDTATVLVFLDQSVTSSLLVQPRYDRNRLVVTMRRVDGRWLVADIRAL